jgi:hypothetical protein
MAQLGENGEIESGGGIGLQRPGGFQFGSLSQAGLAYITASGIHGGHGDEG